MYMYIYIYLIFLPFHTVLSSVASYFNMHVYGHVSVVQDMQLRFWCELKFAVENSFLTAAPGLFFTQWCCAINKPTNISSSLCCGFWVLLLHEGRTTCISHPAHTCTLTGLISYFWRGFFVLWGWCSPDSAASHYCCWPCWYSHRLQVLNVLH